MWAWYWWVVVVRLNVWFSGMRVSWFWGVEIDGYVAMDIGRGDEVLWYVIVV